MSEYQNNNNRTMTTNISNSNNNSSNNSISIQHQHYQHHDDYDYYNNNYYNNSTEPGVFLSCEEMERIKDAYLDNVSNNITGAVAAIIEKAIQSGLTGDEIVMAIEETGFAPFPSPRYLQKVLENWAENGVTISKIRHEISSNRGNPWWKCERRPWHK